ncbi:MAG: hypothetical protein PVG75_04655 [Thioalkalispiraceae bacterium]|jgi:hypothetical protein
MNVSDLSLRLRELVDDYSNQRIGHDEYRAQRKVILDELDLILNGNNPAQSAESSDGIQNLHKEDGLLGKMFAVLKRTEDSNLS